jgi:DNA-binding MarR family transcriptional regulator
VIISEIQSSLQSVTQSTNQIRVHEELLRAAGVRLDRAGAALLYKLRLYADTPFRVTSLAALLGVDAPTVTRKVQQLERLGYVAREPDPDDGRASLIRLTTSGQETVDRILAAHRERLTRLFDGWDDGDVRRFGALLEKFAQSIRGDTEVGYGDGHE